MRGTLGAQGLQAVMTVDGATDADVFRTSVTRVRGPTLRPGDMVVMDHLRAHKAVGVQQALARRGARLVYLPPYVAGPVAHRTVLVDSHNGAAHRQGADPECPRHGHHTDAADGHTRRRPWLV